ncbi:hypothetical protein GF340_04225 [Candidatus Peregrinibacteria bacterium]|nr:hypothetical protein [Candidatus Peregrinibacteria bacterium]
MTKQKATNQRLLPKELKNANKRAFDSFDFYKKTMEVIDRANAAMGKKTSYTATQSSTLNYKTDINGLVSTSKI